MDERGAGAVNTGVTEDQSHKMSGPEPTEEDRRTLRKVSDHLPWPAFLVAMIELCERFTYYGLSGPFQNYIQNSYNDPNGLPGAIGLGETGATSLTDFFQFWCYVILQEPDFCRVLRADKWTGDAYHGCYCQ